MHNVEIQGPGLDEAQRVVIVVHGMSTTVDTLKAGYPSPEDGTITKLYWRLPVLREGGDALKERRSKDVFLNLFAAVIDESRAELRGLIQSLGKQSVGLFGFSIGSLIALWGAVDNPEVKAVVTVGGVPDLNYLQRYYPDYPWSNAAVKARLGVYRVGQHTDRLASVPTLIVHGEADDVARWDWMRPFAEELTTVSPESRIQKFTHMRHRLYGESPEENDELDVLRHMADAWFRQHLS